MSPFLLPIWIFEFRLIFVRDAQIKHTFEPKTHIRLSDFLVDLAPLT